MAYNPDELFQQAKQVAESKKLIFVEEIVSFLPCTKTTFYEYFPADSDEMHELKTIINNNKVAIKSTMRKKWYDSENPTLQLALYRLTSTTEEHKKLNQKYQDVTTGGDKLNRKIEVEIIEPNATPEEEN
jgi:hypothetical protein